MKGKAAPGMVRITLAHHLSRQYAVRHGLEDRDYAPLEQIEITPESAQDLIGAGYAQGIDTDDPAAVAEAVTPDRPTQDTPKS